ncbi:MAG: ABC transporter permease [Chloroflexaceae bacterium]|nr:ABC transporter permease [Chloroflexaceae bacterium]
MAGQQTVDFWHRLRHNRLALIGLIYLGWLTVVAFAAPLLAPHNPVRDFPGYCLQPPSWLTHTVTTAAPATDDTPWFWLGTDRSCRDIFSRLIYGSRTSLLVGVITMLLTAGIGTCIGLIAGFYGHLTDALLMRLADIVLAFPSILLFIVVMFALRDTPVGTFMNGFPLLFALLALVSWVDIARLVRSEVLSLKERAFVEAARALGAPMQHILLRHMLPQTIGLIIVASVLLVPSAMITEATLAFLGIGLRQVTDPDALFPVSWGTMILEGKNSMNTQPWLLIASTMAIALTTLAVTLVGDGLRDVFDPGHQRS